MNLSRVIDIMVLHYTKYKTLLANHSKALTSCTHKWVWRIPTSSQKTFFWSWILKSRYSIWISIQFMCSVSVKCMMASELMTMMRARASQKMKRLMKMVRTRWPTSFQTKILSTQITCPSRIWGKWWTKLLRNSNQQTLKMHSNNRMRTWKAKCRHSNSQLFKACRHLPRQHSTIQQIVTQRAALVVFRRCTIHHLACKNKIPKQRWMRHRKGSQRWNSRAKLLRIKWLTSKYTQRIRSRDVEFGCDHWTTQSKS